MPMLNIGSTKQLFFDDYLIESLVNAKQGLNPAVKVDDNPILRPERPWEGNFMRPIKVIFDPTDQIFKMWYASSTITVHLENGVPVPGGAAGLVLDTRGNVMCLATSEDGFTGSGHRWDSWSSMAQRTITSSPKGRVYPQRRPSKICTRKIPPNGTRRCR